MLVLISGVSGSGKNTVIKELVNRIDNLYFFPSCTTREKRSEEIDGRDYHFLNEKTFREMIDKGELFEHSYHHNNLYGIPKKPVYEAIKEKKNLIKDIDVNGKIAMVKILKNKIDLITIFLDISKDEMKKRLIERGNLKSEEDLKRRMERYDFEREQKDDYDYVIENNDLENTVEKIIKILKKEK